MTNRDTSNPAADFYLGRGADAAYLGTVAGPQVDDIPEALDLFLAADLLNPDAHVFEAGDFRAAVNSLIDGGNNGWGDLTTRSWPHEYDTSEQTEWTYMFDKGSVFVYYRGHLVQVTYCNGSRKPAEFPRVTRTERNHP